jgi:hypothetical protein
MTNLIPTIRVFIIFFFGFFMGAVFLPTFLHPFSVKKYLTSVTITTVILLVLIGCLALLGGL